MKFFVGTAEVDEIKDLTGFGLVDGITTNPSLIAKSDRNFKEVVAEICTLTDTPVSAEVAALDTAGMIAEGRHLAAIADNVVVKLLPTLDGLRACAHQKRKGSAQTSHSVSQPIRHSRRQKRVQPIYRLSLADWTTSIWMGSTSLEVSGASSTIMTLKLKSLQYPSEAPIT